MTLLDENPRCNTLMKRLKQLEISPKRISIPSRLNSSRVTLPNFDTASSVKPRILLWFQLKVDWSDTKNTKLQSDEQMFPPYHGTLKFRYTVIFKHLKRMSTVSSSSTLMNRYRNSFPVDLTINFVKLEVAIATTSKTFTAPFNNIRISLPSIQCSAAPPSFRLCCLNCVKDLIWLPRARQ